MGKTRKGRQGKEGKGREGRQAGNDLATVYCAALLTVVCFGRVDLIDDTIAVTVFISVCGFVPLARL